MEERTPKPEANSFGNVNENTSFAVPTDATGASTTVLPTAPNGGLQAWTQVVIGHLVFFNCWGYLTSFGLFQSYYASSLSATSSAISWIGSIQIFLVYFVGTFSGRALDAGYFHACLNLGCFLQILGVFMTSISNKYWQLLLAQGVCKGLGDGLVFCPTISLVATYFSTKRSWAMGCTAAGGATGGIIFPLIARQLMPKVGFGWTVRTMGFVILFNSFLIATAARVRLPPRRVGPLVEWGAFQEVPYTLFCIGMFLNFWAIFFAYFYVSFIHPEHVVMTDTFQISMFARTIIGVPSSTSLILLLTMNAVGVPGRLLGGLVADKLGPINTITPVAFFAGLSIYCWIAVSNLTGLYLFCIMFGFFGGAIQSLFPASCASLTVDLEKMGVRNGMCFSFVSIACLTGAPIAGALVQSHGGGFTFAQVFGGSALLAGTSFLTAARISKTGFSIRRQV